MLQKFKIIKKLEAAQVTLFIHGETKRLTAQELTDDDVKVIMGNYPDTYGLFFEEKTTAKKKKAASPTT